MNYSSDTPARSMFRQGYCEICIVRTVQMQQCVNTPEELGRLDFYQCLRCGSPLNSVGGSLAEWELSRIRAFSPKEYRNRPLCELGKLYISFNQINLNIHN